MSIWKRAGKLLLKPLPEGRLSLYFALASCVLAFAALFYAGRIFDLQRRDALLFELAGRYQQFERALLLAGCLHPNPAGQVHQDIEDLRRVSDRLSTTLMLKRDATLGQLLDARDDVLTIGTRLVISIDRETMRMRSGASGSDRQRLAIDCGA